MIPFEYQTIQKNTFSLWFYLQITMKPAGEIKKNQMSPIQVSIACTIVHLLSFHHSPHVVYSSAWCCGLKCFRHVSWSIFARFLISELLNANGVVNCNYLYFRIELFCLLLINDRVLILLALFLISECMRKWLCDFMLTCYPVRSDGFLITRREWYHALHHYV